jgi:2,3-bisphosphoglycerate-dependent phosphoglycerate mutase
MIDSAAHRDPAPADDEAVGESVLWLIRHGESTWNKLGLAQGHNDVARLTRRGRRQARITADRLSDRPVRTVFSSDLSRARHTAIPIATAFGLTVILDSRLRERSLGVLEGTASALITPASTGLAEGRVADPDAYPPGGESVRDLYLRAAAFADELAVPRPGAAPEEIVVVAHGGTLRVLDAYLHGVPVEQMRWDLLGNATVLKEKLT